MCKYGYLRANETNQTFILKYLSSLIPFIMVSEQGGLSRVRVSSNSLSLPLGHWSPSSHVRELLAWFDPPLASPPYFASNLHRSGPRWTSTRSRGKGLISSQFMLESYIRQTFRHSWPFFGVYEPLFAIYTMIDAFFPSYFLLSNDFPHRTPRSMKIWNMCGGIMGVSFFNKGLLPLCSSYCVWSYESFRIADSSRWLGFHGQLLRSSSSSPSPSTPSSIMSRHAQGCDFCYFHYSTRRCYYSTVLSVSPIWSSCEGVLASSPWAPNYSTW